VEAVVKAADEMVSEEHWIMWPNTTGIGKIRADHGIAVSKAGERLRDALRALATARAPEGA
jgi:hypothetical protein